MLPNKLLSTKTLLAMLNRTTLIWSA